MACLSFSKLEKGSVTMESNVQSFELLCVCLVKAEHQSLVWDMLTLHWNVSSAEVDVAREKFHWGKGKTCAEFSEDRCWVVVQRVQAGQHLVVGVLRTAILAIVEFVLACEGVVTFKSLGLSNQSCNFLTDEVGMCLYADDIVTFSHHGVDALHSTSVEARDAVHLRELSEGLDEFIG